MPSHVLVAGAAGLQGGAVGRALLARGHHVRGLDRDASTEGARRLASLGAPIVQAAYDDHDLVVRAAGDVDAAFVMASPYGVGVEAEVASATALLESLASAGVPFIVYSSVANADTDTGVPHFESKARIERRLAALGIPGAVVAPTYFMENVLAPWMLPSLRERVLPVALPPDRILHQTAVDDIAEFVAHVIENPDRFAGGRYDIASDALTGLQTARAITTASGFPVSYVEVDPQQIRASGDDDNARMFEWLATTGYTVDPDMLRRKYPEVGWRRFDEWAAGVEWSSMLEPVG